MSVRITSTDNTTRSVRVYTESGEDIKNIESVQINKLVAGELIYATIKVMVGSLDVVADEVIEESEQESFEVRDVVECINDFGSCQELKLGAWYSIRKVDYDYMVKVDGCDDWFSPDRFVLATNTELQTNRELLNG
jgi:hypothetical protein